MKRRKRNSRRPEHHIDTADAHALAARSRTQTALIGAMKIKAQDHTQTGAAQILDLLAVVENESEKAVADAAVSLLLATAEFIREPAIIDEIGNHLDAALNETRKAARRQHRRNRR